MVVSTVVLYGIGWSLAPFFGWAYGKDPEFGLGMMTIFGPVAVVAGLSPTWGSWLGGKFKTQGVSSH